MQVDELVVQVNARGTELQKVAIKLNKIKLNQKISSSFLPKSKPTRYYSCSVGMFYIFPQ